MMMTEATLMPDERMVRVHWQDGTTGDFPFLWLRDTCPSAWHPETQERVLDLLDVPADIAPEAVAVEDGHLRIDWAGEAGKSRFPLDWLRTHRPGARSADPAAIPPATWRGNAGAEAIPRTRADAILTDDGALAAWLRDLKRSGITIVEGLPPDREAGMAVARRVGFLRETNFGRTFHVVSKPNPNNSAYTADALPLHTDLPNQELPPGIQFLHCLANEAEGGGSVFADGVALAEDLRARDPEAFETLATVSIPFRFHDGSCDIRRRQRVINLDDEGAVSEVCWSGHLAGVLDLRPAEIEPFYRAYRAFMRLTRDPAYRIELKLSGGEVVVFDNRRVLHGRAAFDPSTGYRELHGCYVDRGEMDSRLRVLARAGH
jgi:gamma-butyrobetaine dioxygenase